MTQTTDSTTQQHSAATDDDLETTLNAVRDLAGAACEADADQIAIDIRVEERGPVMVVEDDGAGMTPEQLERFFAATTDEEPFYGADEVHVATTRDGHTLKAHSDDPPEYRVTELDAARWEEGTRVEIVNYDAPDDITERVTEEEIRDRAALDETDWTALLNVHVDDHAHTIRRLDGDSA